MWNHLLFSLTSFRNSTLAKFFTVSIVCPRYLSTLVYPWKYILVFYGFACFGPEHNVYTSERASKEASNMRCTHNGGRIESTYTVALALGRAYPFCFCKSPSPTLLSCLPKILQVIADNFKMTAPPQRQGGNQSPVSAPLDMPCHQYIYFFFPRGTSYSAFDHTSAGTASWF